MKDNRIKDADRLALAELYKSDTHAFAEVITEYVDPVYMTLDLASAFMPTTEFDITQMPRRVFKGKYHVRQIVPGQITLSEQITVRDQTVSYNIDILSAKAGYNTLELAHGGPAYNPETVRSDVQKALSEKILMRGWNALANIWTSANASALTIPGAANSNYLDAASGPLTSALLDAAIDHTNYWSGGVRSIIGTEVALAPLTTFGQYRLISGTNTDNYVTLNAPAGTFQNVSPYGSGSKGVESYRGVSNIIRVPQIFDETVFPKRPLIPNDYVLVVGEDIGRFITYGGPQFKEYIDNEPTPPYWTYETYVQFGMMIWNAMGITKIGGISQTIP